MGNNTVEGQQSPRRKVQITAYLLAILSLLLTPIVAFFLYGTLQGLWGETYSDYKQLVKFDPSREGGHLLPSMDTLVTGERQGRPIRWVTNSKGFRNTSEFAYEISKDTFRILLMGDSYVDGFRTDQERTIGYGLEENLSKIQCRRGYRQYEVMISGHNNPAQALYNYQEHGWKYSPQLVILGITVGNDITPRDYKKRFWPEPGASGGDVPRLIISDRPAEQPKWRDLFLPNDAYLESHPIHHFVLDVEYSIRHALPRLVPGLGYVVPPQIGRPGPNTRFRVHAGANLTSLGLFYDPPMLEVEEWFRDLSEIVLTMQRQVAANGGEFIVVIFPTRAQADSRDWELLREFYSIDESKFRLDYPDARILQYCRNNQISCLDLLPSFRISVQREGARLIWDEETCT